MPCGQPHRRGWRRRVGRRTCVDDVDEAVGVRDLGAVNGNDHASLIPVDSHEGTEHASGTFRRDDAPCRRWRSSTGRHRAFDGSGVESQFRCLDTNFDTDGSLAVMDGDDGTGPGMFPTGDEARRERARNVPEHDVVRQDATCIRVERITRFMLNAYRLLHDTSAGRCLVLGDTDDFGTERERYRLHGRHRDCTAVAAHTRHTCGR
jgi:hypothetical protein